MTGSKRQDDSKKGSAAGGGSICGRSKNVVSVGKIIEQSHKNKQKADSKRYACEHWHYEMDVRTGGEAEPEERNDEHRSAEEGEGQTAEFFTVCPRGSASTGLGKEEVPVPEDRKAEARTTTDREVAKTSDTWAKAVEVGENDGESLKGHVEYGVDKGEVAACCRHNGLRDNHAKRTGENNCEKL